MFDEVEEAFFEPPVGQGAFDAAAGDADCVAGAVPESAGDGSRAVRGGVSADVGSDGAGDMVTAASGCPGCGINVEGVCDGEAYAVEVGAGIVLQAQQLWKIRVARALPDERADFLDEGLGAQDELVHGGGERRNGGRQQTLGEICAVGALRGGGVLSELGQDSVVIHPVEPAGRPKVSAAGAPSPVFGSADETGSDGVEVNVAAQLEPVAFVLDEDGMEAALEEVSGALVTSVEIAGTARVEDLHSRGEVGAGRLEEEVVVIVHKGEGEDAPVGLRGDALEAGEPGFAVAVVTDDFASLVTARGHVVDRIGELDSQRPGHASLNYRAGLCLSTLITNYGLTPSVCGMRNRFLSDGVDRRPAGTKMRI